MIKFTFILLGIISFSACSKETYTYSGKEFKVYYSVCKEANRIEALDLSNNGPEIEGKTYDLKSVKYLNLSGKGILTLDPRICSLTSLKILILNENEGINLPPCLFKMKNLKVLSLIGCRLEGLPQGLYKMTNLEQLAVMGNSFSEEELKHLKQSLPKTKVIAYLD